MLFLLVAHIVAALAAPALVRVLGRGAFLVLALVPAGCAVWALTRAPAVLDGSPLVERVSWLPAYELNLDLHVDPLAMVMMLLVTGVGALVLVYCARYFDPGDRSVGRFAATLVAFAGAMLGLVVADNLILLYVFWELTTVFSYLLIGHYRERQESRRAALQSLVVTTLGGLAMLVGLLLLGHTAGSFTVSAILADPPPATGPVTWALVLILVGALSKSAQFPFHFWLPGAMAAPTPVSAYLHAAAMVKAGVFLVALLGPAFAGYPPWRAVVVGLGLLTMLLGGWRALRQYDLKLLLAYGTVSQLGLLMVLLGTGTRTAAVAGLAMLVAHAAAKGALFMVVGIVDHATGTRDMRRLRGLRRETPVVFWATVVALASMVGLPPTAGFVAKEAAYQAFIEAGPEGLGGPWRQLVLAGVVAGSALTLAYGARFLWGGFFDGPGGGAVAGVRHRPGWLFTSPPVLLAALGVALGCAAPLWNGAVAAYADQYGTGGGHGYYLALWHGFGLALGLTGVTLAVGALLFVARERVLRAQAAVALRFSADGVYHRVMLGMDRVAFTVTTTVQRGSLTGHLAAILVVLAVLPVLALVSGGPWHTRTHPWDSPVQLAAGAVIAIAAVALVAMRHRLSAVLLAGVTGYGTSVLFVLEGAPDLALTQFLVETVSLVLFVLVLRRLPAHFPARRPGRIGRAWRALLAVGAGLVTAGLLIAAGGARVERPVSDPGMAQAAVEGGGRNIVNVTLVDLRAWDTFGEISVLSACTAGVTGLVFLRRLLTAVPRATGTQEAQGAVAGLLRAAYTVAAGRRSLLFEVMTRLTFHTAVVLSLYLLFAGHNAPGGGFAGGMTAGLAMVLRYLAGGRFELGEAAPIGAQVLIGAGLTLAALTALAPLAFGGTVLQSAAIDFGLPLVGQVHTTTALFFDIGVYLLVVGMVLDFLRALGAEIDRQWQEREVTAWS